MADENVSTGSVEVPELALTSDGELVGTMLGDEPENLEPISEEVEQEDSQEEEDGEAEEVDEQEERQSEEQEPEYLTAEEIAEIGLANIEDPEKLPPAMRPYYELAKKTVEAEKKEPVKKKVDKPRLPKLDFSPDQIRRQSEAGKKIVARKFGAEYDDWDPAHRNALDREIIRIQADEQKKHAKIQANERARVAIEHFKAVDDDFSKVSPILKQLIKEDNGLRNEIMETLSSGDTAALSRAYKKARDIYDGKPAENIKKTPPKKQATPPKTIPAGKPKGKSRNNYKPSDLRGKNTDDQADMLIKMGLV